MLYQSENTNTLIMHCIPLIKRISHHKKLKVFLKNNKMKK